MTIRRALIISGVVYSTLCVLSYFLRDILASSLHQGQPLSVVFIAAFLLFWTACIFIGNYILSTQTLSLRASHAFLYMGTLALCGPLGEVLTNMFYTTIVGSPLWTYHIFPVHNGSTSMLMFFLWSLYGLHLYLFHQNSYIINAPYKNILIALFIALDALILEYFVNITSIFLFGSYLFYYFPNDLLHLTTLAAAPFYLIAGYCASQVLPRVRARPILFGTLGFIAGYISVFLI